MLAILRLSTEQTIKRTYTHWNSFEFMYAWFELYIASYQINKYTNDESVWFTYSGCDMINKRFFYHQKPEHCLLCRSSNKVFALKRFFSFAVEKKMIVHRRQTNLDWKEYSYQWCFSTLQLRIYVYREADVHLMNRCIENIANIIH